MLTTAKIIGGQVNLRPASKQDEPFIYSTWLRSYKPSKRNSGVPASIYYKRQGKIIDAILARPETKSVIATAHDDPEHFFGHAAWEEYPNAIVLHYFYVKQSFRRLGIGTALLREVTQDWSSKHQRWISHIPANEDIWEWLQSLAFVFEKNQR